MPQKYKEDKMGKTNEKGITLIALVVTIIVLLILAGISIGALTGNNGIINQAQNAKNDTQYQQWSEQIDVAIIDVESKNRDPKMDDVIDELINKGIISDKSQVDKKTGAITTNEPSYVIGDKLNDYIEFGPGMIADKNETYTDVNGDTATIPTGFEILEEASTIVDGLVIQDERENQFVWIPVPDVIYDGTTTIDQTYTPMVELQSSTTDYQGMLYTFSGSTSTYQSGYKPGTTSYREPSLVTGNSSDTHARVSSVTGTQYDASSSYYNAILGYSSAMEFGAVMQADFNSMVESVDKYKGFYVGRYELGLEGTTPVVKNASKNTNVTTIDSTNTNTYMWYGLYNQCKKLAEENNLNSSVTSGMIWGSQYDAMLNWMAKQGETVGTADENKRNTITTTGSNSNDVIRNVYDLYGCHREWTLESDSSSGRVFRGGYSRGNIAPSGRSLNSFPTFSSGGISSRPTLYIK